MSTGVRALISAESETNLRESLCRYGVPEHMHDGVVDYVAYGVPPGGFLRAVLENNLKEAVARGSNLNAKALAAYVRVLYNDVPADCWGSPEKVKQWLSHAATVRP